MLRRTLLAFAFLLLAASASAQMRWGGRVGVVTGGGTDPLVGAEILLPFRDVFAFNPSIEGSFGDRDMITLNADLQYRIRPAGGPITWLGAGIAEVLREDEDLSFGANIVAGAGMSTGNYFVYLQTKRLMGDDDRFSVVLGARF